MAIMPKGQSPKLKGTLWSIPVKYVDVSSLIPRTADSNGLVIVKLKKRACVIWTSANKIYCRFIKLP